MAVIVDTNWADGSNTGSISPWIDVIGGLYIGSATALQFAANQTNLYVSQLLLPTSYNTTSPIQIDVFFITPAVSDSNYYIGVVFRADGASNFYSVSYRTGLLDFNVALTGHVANTRTLAGAPNNQEIIGPLRFATNTAYCMRVILEPSGLVVGTKATVRFFLSTGGTTPAITGSQINGQSGSYSPGTGDALWFDNTSAVQPTAQPTGGQVGIWLQNSQTSAALNIQRLTVSTVAATGYGTLAQVPLTGVNLAGGSFTPPIYNITNDTINLNYYASKGMNIIRYGFLWETMQPDSLIGGVWTPAALDPTTLAYFDSVISIAAGLNVTIILDCHNYGEYNGVTLGTGGLPLTAMNDLWTLLATHYASTSNVIFGIMNEPGHAIATSDWLTAINSVLPAIRWAGATTQLILVQGASGDQAAIWTKSVSGNSTVFGPNVVDPNNNFAFEAHQYFDSDFSGTHSTCISDVESLNTLWAITEWAVQHGVKLFLGEFNGGGSATCLNCVQNAVAFMNSWSNVWLGWTIWAGGPWPSSYFFTMQWGVGGSNAPQMNVIIAYMAGTPFSYTIPEVPLIPVATPATLPTKKVGFNLEGYEYNQIGPVGPIFGTTYFIPTIAEMDAIKPYGVTLIRISFDIGRMYGAHLQPITPSEIARITVLIEHARAIGMWILLDPHNFGTMWDDAHGDYDYIGGPNVPNSWFADFWARMATNYQNYPNVIYGLMNEPVFFSTSGITAASWRVSATAAATAIRAVGGGALNQWIFVPGIQYTGAWTWTTGNSSDPGGGINGVAFIGYVDPTGGPFAFEFHQYLDADGSGTNTACTLGGGSTRLVDATNWLVANGYQGFLGEFAWPSVGGVVQPDCAVEGPAMIAYINNNPAQWIGWSWFGSGPVAGSSRGTNLLPNTEVPGVQPQVAELFPITGLLQSQVCL